MSRRWYPAIRHIQAAVIMALGVQVALGDTPAPLDIHDQPAISALLANLASSDFSTREQAQKRLDSIPADEKEDLRRLAQSITDPEVQARLLTRVDALEELAATEPPPISLNLKNATTGELAAALSKSLNIPVSAWNDENLRFSLDADNIPFWEVYRGLSQQHPFSFSTNPGFVNLVPASINKLPANSVHRGFMTILENLQWQQPGGQLLVIQNGGNIQIIGQVQLQGIVINGNIVAGNNIVNLQNMVVPPNIAVGPGAGPPPNPKLTGLLAFAHDPRVHVLSSSGPEWTQIVDDEGNRVGAMGNSASTRDLNFLQRTFTMDTPDKLGKSLNLHGQMTVTVATDEKVVRLENLATHINQTFSTGKSDVTLQNFMVTPAAPNVPERIYRLVLGVKSANPPAPGFGGPLPANLATATQVTLIDATGRPLISGALSTMADYTVRGVFVEPLTLVLTTALKTKDVIVPIDFKGIPIPPH